MTYHPTLVPQFDGSAFQRVNCGPATGAVHLDRDTRGAHRTTAWRVRDLGGDDHGGTNLGREDYALEKGWPVPGTGDHMDVRPKLAWPDAMHHLDIGQGFSASVSYEPFSGTKYDGSPGFRKNHRIFVNERDTAKKLLLIYDSLDDERRPGIPKAPLWVPEGLVREAAGLLDVDGKGHRLGMGWVQLGFTRDTEPNYKIVATAGTFFRYFVSAGGKWTHDKGHKITPQTIPCSAPKLYQPASAKYHARSLVKLMAGQFKNWYVMPNDTLVLRTA